MNYLRVEQINLSFTSSDIGGLHAEVLRKIDEHRECVVLMLQYMETRNRLGDMHGVMDASADIRELNAKIDTLSGIATALARIRR